MGGGVALPKALVSYVALVSDEEASVNIRLRWCTIGKKNPKSINAPKVSFLSGEEK